MDAVEQSWPIAWECISATQAGRLAWLGLTARVIVRSGRGSR